MFTETVSPRFCETDALGHINNTVVPMWFEKAREPVFRFFSPDLNVKDWRLILARIEVDFRAQIFYGKDLDIHTRLERIGNSSMVVTQDAVQEGVICAVGKSVLIHFDYQQQVATPIPDSIREQLQEHISS
ncbi:thioesterase [Endozoicomonas sp. (ex Bugula neritina AB1)]|nr:thioesterase [Endozoicomonas sp. (ex Bugula neritina AB1)]